MCFKRPVPVRRISANADAESMYNLYCTLSLFPSVSSPTRNLHKRYKKRLSTIKPLAAYNSASQLVSATEAWVRHMLVSNDPLRKINPELLDLRVALQSAHEESLNASKMNLPSAVQSGLVNSVLDEVILFPKVTDHFAFFRWT